MSSLGPESHKLDVLKEQSDLIEDGTPTRYHLQPTTDSHNESEPYRTITFGERDTNKPHKTILLIGEGGTGKTKLINAMVNHMLSVEREDIWFEITDDQSDRSQAHSQTTIITVYEFYLQESQTDLTIIDTPGYGDAHRVDPDKNIAKSLFRLSKSAEEISGIHAVCLVIQSTQTRLSDRDIYIFDAVQSLFGKDFAENIVLLFTHSRGAIPKNVLTAVEEAKIKCAVNEVNKPVYFMFENCQSKTADKEGKMMHEQLRKLSSEGMAGFFTFLDTIKPKALQMTRDVLQQRMKLEAQISTIKTHIQSIKQKKQEEEEEKKELTENKNFEYEVEVTYKQKVDIDRAVARVATCCTVCEENCHYPGCWWITFLCWCSVMRNNHCTVCTNKCHYSKHVKEDKIYVTKTRNEKRINEELKRQYEDNIRACESELNDLQQEKLKRVMDAFHCVESLQMIALNADSLIVLQHIDFLIELLKEIKEAEKIQTLENIKKRAGEEKHRALEYKKRCVTSENQKF